MADAVTIASSIRRPVDAVYRFARDPLNLERWITSFVRGVEQRGDQWFLKTTDSGDWEFAFVEENGFGVLDHRVFTPDGKIFYNPMRVVANGEDSLVTFTLFRQEGMSDAEFARDQGSIQRDLELLKKVLEA